jgi:hypothetical protein
MFRPYKAIIRHHMNEDFYRTAHFLKSSFHLARYYFSIFYLVALPSVAKVSSCAIQQIKAVHHWNYFAFHVVVSLILSHLLSLIF